MNPNRCQKIGSIVAIEPELGLAIIRMEISSAESFPTLEDLRNWAENFSYDKLDTPIFVQTTHHDGIRGQRARTPVYMRLPGTKTFQLLHSIRLTTPICAGDCGSRVVDQVSGAIVGCVVAGSPKTGLCLVSPTKAALERIVSLLGNLTRTASSGYPAPKPPTHDRVWEYFNKELIGPRNDFWQSQKYKSSTVLLGIKDSQTLEHPHGKTVNTPPFAPIVTHGQLSYFKPESSFLDVPKRLGDIDIDIQGILDKGFFLSDGNWTCYRRNYFSCICSFGLVPAMADAVIQYMPDGEFTEYQVLGFAVSISANVADSKSKPVDLIQHTPKRDKGPTAVPEKVQLNP
ncbi:hypothetical protein RRF57_001424 [Xylaria bambusicola]|uniref:NDT80 domain-containing protein n=1 Tax=Xylaria bambusicola TaxID=326684 RepID=A0AAN7UBV5_9PEZI